MRVNVCCGRSKVEPSPKLPAVTTAPLHVRVHECMCKRRVRAVHMCFYACVRACVRVCVCVCASKMCIRTMAIGGGAVAKLPAVITAPCTCVRDTCISNKQQE